MAVVYSKVLLFDPPLIYTSPDTCVFGAVGVGNSGSVIRQGESFLRLPETDNRAKGFLTRLYCIYFTVCSRVAHFVSVLCMFCAYIVPKILCRSLAHWE